MTTTENKFCLVTSLFNINRETMLGNDGRSWGDYLEWFGKTLQIKAPMIIFVEEDLIDFIIERRQYPTKIITHSVDEIPYYFLKEEIQDILDSPEYQEKIDAPERIECKHSMYSVVQYSKFKWLEQAIELNPFSSKYFFWIDAGASRHFIDFDVNIEFPSEQTISALDESGSKFLLQLNMEYYKDIASAEKLSDNYLLDARAITCGSFFGGEWKAVLEVSKKIDDILIHKMIGMGFVNNEQIALAYLLKNNPDLFIEYRRYNGNHMDIFRELS
jgi:hypothetical protein